MKPIDCESLHTVWDSIKDREVTESDKDKVRKLARQWAGKQESPSDTLNTVLEHLGLLC